MIGVYREILARLSGTCRRLKFRLVLDEDFIARFERRDGWAVVLDGDRASYPAFTISILRSTSPETTRSYAVWLLMQHFAPQLGTDRSRPTLENQLRFIEGFAKVIFGQEQSYRDGYLKLETAARAAPAPAIRRLGEGYEPHVDEDGGKLTYSIPVDSSFVGVSFSFEITQTDLNVLLSDPYRRAALEVVAHTILQRSMQRGEAKVTQAGFEQILLNVLHSSPPKFEAYIARVSREHNMSVSHYIDQVLARRSTEEA